jgi:hypothetical protein
MFFMTNITVSRSRGTIDKVGMDDQDMAHHISLNISELGIGN